jgi:hypothetical protein
LKATGSWFRIPSSEGVFIFQAARNPESGTRNPELQPSRRYAREFQLVILTEGPRFYTASAQVLGELRGEPVNCKNTLWLNQLYVPHQIGIVCVI